MAVDQFGGLTGWDLEGFHGGSNVYLSARDLQRWNGMGRSTKLIAGRRIRIAPPSGSAPAKASSRVASARTPTVRRGETLTGLAKRYGVTLTELKAANRRTLGRRGRIAGGGLGGGGGDPGGERSDSFLLLHPLLHRARQVVGEGHLLPQRVRHLQEHEGKLVSRVIAVPVHPANHCLLHIIIPVQFYPQTA